MRSPLSMIEGWLCCAQEPRTADVLFVLGGADDRKLYAIDLYREGLASKLLFSVARFDIRRFSKMALPVPVNLLEMAAPTPAPLRHFFVLFSDGSVEVEYVRPTRMGTLTEVTALARWLERHAEVQSLLLLSNGIHLRRIRMCCRAVLPPKARVRFIASPEPLQKADAGRRELWHRTRDALLEVAKLTGYWGLLRIRGLGGARVAFR